MATFSLSLMKRQKRSSAVTAWLARAVTRLSSRERSRKRREKLSVFTASLASALTRALIPECIEEDDQKVPMVPDLALLLVEIQNMRKRWADEDAALTDFHLYGVLFTDYECDGDVTADA
jgi:hypothetical protein